MAVHAIVIRRGHSRDVSGDRLISPPVFGAITHLFEGKTLERHNNSVCIAQGIIFITYQIFRPNVLTLMEKLNMTPSLSLIILSRAARRPAP